jgi:preprotein translocase subunit SecB
VSDPAKAPGYTFKGVRLLSAQVKIIDRSALPQTLGVNFEYSDSPQVNGREVLLTQRIGVRVTPTGEPTRDLLTVETVLEGVFEGSEDVNIEPSEFAQHHAPPIMFPFSREWIFRLTSDCAPFPPILLPPMNVLQVRKAHAGTTETRPGPAKR